MARRIGPEDPLRTRATDNGPVDGWRGARIGAVLRDRTRRDAARVPAEVDIGEPGPPLVVGAFVAAAVAVTLWEFSAYGASPTSLELARAGGTSVGAVATGEWWKLLTANLLHGDVSHVAFNVVITIVVGRLLEHLAGRLVVLAAVLWSALLSSVGAILLGGGAVSIGASGVLYGLLGCALAIDPRGRTAVGVVARPLLLVGVLYTFVVPNVSIGGHVGGFIAGVLVGAASWRRTREEEAPAGRARRSAAIACCALALPLVAVLAIGPEVLPREARGLRSSLVAPVLARELRGAELTSGKTLEDDVGCDGTDDPLVYRCGPGDDRTEYPTGFSRGIDQWSVRLRG